MRQAGGAGISPRYPFVEALSGALSGYIAWHFGITWAAVAFMTFAWVMIALAFIDLDTFYLPDNMTLLLLWVGLVAHAFQLLPQQLAGAAVVAGGPPRRQPAGQRRQQRGLAGGKFAVTERADPVPPLVVQCIAQCCGEVVVAQPAQGQRGVTRQLAFAQQVLPGLTRIGGELTRPLRPGGRRPLEEIVHEERW